MSKDSEKRRQLPIKAEEKLKETKERRRPIRKVEDRVVVVAGGDKLIMEKQKKIVPDKETKEVRRRTANPAVAMRKAQAN